MKKENGKERFLGLIADMVNDKQNRGKSVSIELGTFYKKEGVQGIIPDSYPDSDDPEDDYLSLFTDGIAAGDRVLVIWTDADGDEPDMIAIGPLKSEGGEEDA